MQQSIFDQTARKKQEGIEASYRHSDDVWKREAAARMRFLAEHCDTFTSEDILINLERRGIVTGNNKAIAGVLQAGQRAGLITGTDNFVKSKRPQRHHAPIMVWKSLVRRQYAAG